jgi:CRP-like cAMP-binding protein
MFSRFDAPLLVRATQQELFAAGETLKCDVNSILGLKPSITYIVISGIARVRDHSKSAKQPEVLWSVQPGDYLNLECCEFMNHPEVICRAKTPLVLLKIVSLTFNELLRRARSSSFIVRQQMLLSFSLFKEFSPQTTDLLIDSLFVFKSVSKGQVILAQLSGSSTSLSRGERSRGDDKVDCDFYVIVSGLCELTGSDGFGLALLGAGDYFGEEALVHGLKGYSSLGSVIAKDAQVDLAVLPSSLFYRLPQYELNKLKDVAKNATRLEIADYHYQRKGARVMRSVSLR